MATFLGELRGRLWKDGPPGTVAEQDSQVSQLGAKTVVLECATQSGRDFPGAFQGQSRGSWKEVSSWGGAPDEGESRGRSDW